MSKNVVTRRQFLRTAAAVAAPAVLPVSLFGRENRRMGKPASDTLRKIEEFWAGYFGCSRDDLHRARTHVVTHRALARYDGALVFRHAAACIISVPDSLPEIERSKLRAAKPAEAFDRPFLSRVFAVNPSNVRNPAGVWIAERKDFKPACSNARLLGDADVPAIRRLAERCGEGDWRNARVAHERKPLFGLFEGDDLVAVSGYFAFGNVLAYTGVLTDPAFRGKGYGKAVVSTTMNSAFEKGFVPMFRAPTLRPAAIAVARSLGFQPYASVIDVELVECEF